MSYLKLPNGVPDFSKAVFSLWFRVPRASVIAAAGHSLPTDDENFSMMQAVLPLLTYGKIQTNANYQLITEDIIHTKPPNSNPVLVRPVGYSAHTAYEVDPCFIGLLCQGDETSPSFNMAFNIQMGDKGVYSDLIYFVTSMDYVEGAGNQALIPGSGFVGTGTGTYKTTIEDGTYGIQDAQNEFFYVLSDKSLEPDTWHHVLLSFDLSGSLAVGEHPSSTCKLWYAIDDIDYRGWENMGPFRDEDDGLDPNTILTRNIYRESGVVPELGGRLFFNHYIAEPSGSYSPTAIPTGEAELPVPTGEAELGLPAASHYVDGIFRCEMAEFQMWTGVTLDTDIESNRRAFVDKDGKPVEPEGTEDDPRSPAEKVLGKKPSILLHGSGNWKVGYNTGTLGIEIDTEGNVTKLPGGQFTPVAKIEKYKPEPALTETPTA